MRKLILWGMASLLLAACASGGDDDMNDLSYQFDKNGEEATSYTFEGVWSVNGKSEDKTYTVTCIYQNNKQVLFFPTLPYKAVLNQLLPDFRDASIVEPATPFSVSLALEGYSSYTDFYGTSDYLGEECGDLSFGVLTDGDHMTTISLGLLYRDLVASVSNTAASCLLVVDRVEVTYHDGTRQTKVVSPEMKLTFVSSKRR